MPVVRIQIIPLFVWLYIYFIARTAGILEIVLNLCWSKKCCDSHYAMTVLFCSVTFKNQKVQRSGFLTVCMSPRLQADLQVDFTVSTTLDGELWPRFKVEITNPLTQAILTAGPALKMWKALVSSRAIPVSWQLQHSSGGPRIMFISDKHFGKHGWQHADSSFVTYQWCSCWWQLLYDSVKKRCSLGWLALNGTQFQCHFFVCKTNSLKCYQNWTLMVVLQFRRALIQKIATSNEGTKVRKPSSGQR